MITQRNIGIVKREISEGYGVEDIAVHYRIPVASVRLIVCEMRALGSLKYLYKKAVS